MLAAFSRTPAGTPRADAGSQRRAVSLEILRGESAAISLVTSYLMPAMSAPCLRAAMAMVVAMHVPKAVARRSVGENASPRPWLSLGASVARALPDGSWMAEQWRSPWYSPVIRTIPPLSAGRRDLQPPHWSSAMNEGSITCRATRTKEARGASKAGPSPLHPGTKMGDRAGGLASVSVVASRIWSSVWTT